MALFTLKDFHQGGLLDSPYQTNLNSLYNAVGLDVFSERGILQTGRTLLKESASSIANNIRKMVNCSDGNTYIFCDGGVVNMRSNVGVYSNPYNGAGAWGASNIIDASEHNGYIYIASGANLYRWAIGGSWVFGGGVTLVGAFTAGDTLYHPMIEKFNTLYIGDGRYIAQVDSNNTYTANTLDLTSTWRITCFCETAREIVIGTTTPTTISGRARVFTWNTYSTNVSNEYVVNDGKVNAMFEVKGSIVINAGLKGAFYQISGFYLQRIKQLALRTASADGWAFGATSLVEVLPNSIVYLNGMAHFGVSAYQANGNPCWLGIYAFGSTFSDSPPILTMPFSISQNVQSVTIPAICTNTSGDILVGWQNVSGGTYGVDTYSSTERVYGGLIDTGYFVLDRRLSTGVKVTVAYRICPSNMTMAGNIYNTAESNISLDFIQDTTRKVFEAYTTVQDVNAFRVSLNYSGAANSTGLAIESIIIETDV